MKIKNLAFFGIMAAILGVNGAARADSTTIIASQAYVDAKDALKQDQSKRYQDTKAAYNALNKTPAEKKEDYPSMFTLEDAITTGATNTINGLNLTNPSGDGVITAVSQSAGQVSATRGLVGTSAIDAGAVTTAKIADANVTADKLASDSVTTAKIANANVTADKLASDSVTTGKIANGAVTTDKIANSNVTMGKTNFVATQGNSSASWLAATTQEYADEHQNKNVLGETYTEAEKKLNANNAEADKYVPTMAAVNSLILKQSEATDTTKSWVVDRNGDLNTKYKTAGDSYVPTVAAVEKRVQEAESAAGGALNNLTLTTEGQSGVIKTVTQTNGQVAVTSGTVDTAEITNSAVTADKLASDSVTTAKIADGNVTAGKLATDSVTTVKIADSNVTSAKLADGAVTTDKIANSNVTMGKTDFIVDQGESEVAWNTASNDSEVPDEKELYQANTAGDKYVPTVAAVEKRVRAAQQAAIDAAGQAASSHIGSDTQNATSGELVTGVTTTNGVVTAVSSTKVADANVADNAAIKATKSVLSSTYATASTNEAVAAADSVETAISKLAKKAADNETNITTNTNAITTLNGNDTTAGSVAKSIKDAVGALDVSDTADGKPVTAVSEADGKISVTRAVVKYDTALDPKLSNVNASNDAGTAMTNCTVGSPCTLTMIWDRTNSKPIYEWTNMDTEDTNAVL